jgi:hypothetical protein
MDGEVWGARRAAMRSKAATLADAERASQKGLPFAYLPPDKPLLRAVVGR